MTQDILRIYWHTTKCAKDSAYSVVTEAYFHPAEVVVKQKYIEYESESFLMYKSVCLHYDLKLQLSYLNVTQLRVSQRIGNYLNNIEIFLKTTN